MRPTRSAKPRDRRRITIVVALAVILVCAGTVAAWAVTRSSTTPVAASSAEASGSVAPARTAGPMPTPSASSPTPTRKPKPTPTSTKRAGGSTSDVGATGRSTTGSATAVGRLFAGDSPWNTTIPAGAAVDPESAAISRAVLTNPGLVVNVAIYAYGIPFYTATASTPRVVLGGRGSIATKIPLDPSWAPNEGGDHKMNVIDPSTGSVYELQGYDQSSESAYWMVQRSISSGLGDGSSSDGRRGPTGSGMSQAGGVIRISELKSGRIDHALSFISSSPLAGEFRYPATSSDGTSSASVGMEEGMRVQLDPSLDLASLHLSTAEYAIARAMQVYGAYCVDNGGGNNQAMGFYAEQPTKATGDPYAALGLSGDWAQLKGIPRSAYRVLAASVTRP